MAEEKARSKLDKAKAFLEEAKALVTVYVVTTTTKLSYICMWREDKTVLARLLAFCSRRLKGAGLHWFLKPCLLVIWPVLHSDTRHRLPLTLDFVSKNAPFWARVTRKHPCS